MRLYNLSADLLDLILRKSDLSHMVVKLWKCGSPSLNQALARSITFVDLRHTVLLPAKFPRMLSKLRSLRHLAIRSTSNLFETPEDGMLMLGMLPESLESLCIMAKDAPSSMLNYAPPRGSRDSSSPSSYALDYHGRGPSHLMDLGGLFPRLSTFELGDGRGEGRCRSDLASFPMLRPSDVAGLPPTLTRLVVDEMVCDWREPRLFSLLPPSLVDLDVNLLYENGTLASDVRADWLAAPPHLQRVRSIKLDSSVRFHSTFDWLPRSLTAGEMRLNPSLTPLEVARMAHLPPHLHKFHIQYLQKDAVPAWPAELPHSLTVLTLGKQTKHILSGNIGHLPRTLTSIDARHSDSINWKALEDLSLSSEALKATQLLWPSNLVRLTIESHFNLEYHVTLLPRTLRTLSIRKIRLAMAMPPDSETIGADFPSSLTELTLFSGAYKVLLPFKLPSSLTYFELDCSAPHPFTLDEKMCLNFPTSLTSLKLPIPAGKEYLLLVERLPCLKVATVLKLEASALRQLRHQTLETFAAKDLIGLDELSESEIFDLFLNLPLSLTELTIRKEEPASKSLNISPNSFSRLTKLVTLHLASLPQLPSKALRHLPKSLTSIRLAIENLDEEDLPFLPPNIKMCFLFPLTSLYTPRVAEYWPCMDGYILESDKAPKDFKDAIAARRRVCYH